MAYYNNNSNIKLLLHFNGKDGSQFVKDYGKDHYINFDGGTEISKNKYALKTSSLKIDGNVGSYVSIDPSEDWDLGNTWTIDFKLILESVSNCVILSTYTGSGNGWEIRLNNNKIEFEIYKVTPPDVMISAIECESNTIYDLRISYDNNTFIGTMNGITIFSQNVPSQNVLSGGNSLLIGNNYIYSSPVNGYIDELIICKNESWDIKNYEIPQWDYVDYNWNNHPYTYHTNMNASISSDHFLFQHPVSGSDHWYIGPILFRSYKKEFLHNKKIKTQAYFAVNLLGNSNTIKFRIYDGKYSKYDNDFIPPNPPIIKGNGIIDEYYTSDSDGDTPVAISNLINKNDFATDYVTVMIMFLGASEYDSSWGKLEIKNLEILNDDNTPFQKILPDADKKYKIAYEKTSGTNYTGAFYPTNGKSDFDSDYIKTNKMLFNNDTLDKFAGSLEMVCRLGDPDGIQHNKINGCGHMSPSSSNIITEYDSIHGYVSRFSSHYLYLRTAQFNNPNTGFIISYFTKVEGGYSGCDLGCGNSDNTNSFVYIDAWDEVSIRQSNNSAITIPHNERPNNTWRHVVVIASNGKVSYYTNNAYKGSASYDNTLYPSSNLCFGSSSTAALARRCKLLYWKDIDIPDNETVRADIVNELYNGGLGSFPSYNYNINRQYPSDHVIDVFALDEVSGSRRSEKNDYVATSINSVGYDVGIGRAYSAKFNGSNYLNIDISERDYSRDFNKQYFSLGMWFKTNMVSGSGTIISCLSTVSPINGFRMTVENTTGIKISLYNDNIATEFTVSGNYADNTYHQIWCLIHGNDCNIYIDGKFVYQKTNLPNDAIGYSLSSTRLGMDTNESNGYIGSLQEFIYMDDIVDSLFIAGQYGNGAGRFYYNP